MNPFVSYLDQFNVLSPNHAKIYDEYTSAADSYSIRIDTRIESFLLDLFANSPRSVIMTGNAGDGKTRLCRTVYERLSGSRLTEWPTSGIIDVVYEKGTIRIVKDLSELTESVILEHLEQLQSQVTNRHAEPVYYLIAANEGKLTKFLSQRPNLQLLFEQVEQRFMDHKKNDEHFHLVNLQDVTSSLYAERILTEWNKEEYWQACEGCSKRGRCIISLNHRKLAQDKVKRNVIEQYRLIDCLGIHVTMREILIHFSYLITGGLTCGHVLQADHSEIEEHAGLAYYNNFYGIHMPDVSAGELGAIRHFRRIDPGQLSISAIDDFLLDGDISGDEQVVTSHQELFDEGIDLLFGYYRKMIELYRTHNPNTDPANIFSQMPKFRRKYFFEQHERYDSLRHALLPYNYFHRFVECLTNKQVQSAIRAELIVGLNHAFVKKLVSRKETQLYAVNENLLIHDVFAINQLRLTVDTEREDIDYVPSRFFLTVNHNTRLEVKLPVFEYLLRLAGGGLFTTLKQEVEILLNTFKNDLIQRSELDEFTLRVFAVDPNKGIFTPHQIDI